MTETVTVKRVGEGNPWQHGITYWDVVFDRSGSEFSCSWGKKGDPPQIGETVEGEFTQKNGDWKFKKGAADFKGGSESQTGTAGSKNAKREWKPESAYDPEKTARIGRAHAQHMAILTCTELGIFESKDAASLERHLKNWTTFYADDVDKAGKAAVQGAGVASRGSLPAEPQGVPATSSAPEQQPADDTHQFLCTVIETAGLAPYPASKLADFILAKFTPEQRKRAEAGLSDFDTQGEILGKLKAAYEQSEGPLPEADTGQEDIPF